MTQGASRRNPRCGRSCGARLADLGAPDLRRPGRRGVPARPAFDDVAPWRPARRHGRATTRPRDGCWRASCSGIAPAASFVALAAADLAEALRKRLRCSCCGPRSRCRIGRPTARCSASPARARGAALRDRARHCAGAGARGHCADVDIVATPDGRFIVRTAAALAETVRTRWPRSDAPADYWNWLGVRVGRADDYARHAGSVRRRRRRIGISLAAFNFRKGCYPGQEIVARMQYLGRLKERLFAFHVDARRRPHRRRRSSPTASASPRRHRRQRRRRPRRRQRPSRRCLGGRGRGRRSAPWARATARGLRRSRFLMPYRRPRRQAAQARSVGARLNGYALLRLVSGARRFRRRPRAVNALLRDVSLTPASPAACSCVATTRARGWRSTRTSLDAARFEQALAAGALRHDVARFAEGKERAPRALRGARLTRCALLVVALDAHPAYDLVVAANRDEYHARPAAPAAWGVEAPFHGILAGRDLAAGGTWLGVRRDGRFAFVTNVRDGRGQDPAARSRGELVPRVLATAYSDRRCRRIAIDGARYNGFNLLRAMRRACWWMSNRSPRRARDRGRHARPFQRAPRHAVAQARAYTGPPVRRGRARRRRHRAAVRRARRPRARAGRAAARRRA